MHELIEDILVDDLSINVTKLINFNVHSIGRLTYSSGIATMDREMDALANIDN